MAKYKEEKKMLKASDKKGLMAQKAPMKKEMKKNERNEKKKGK